MKNLVVIMPWYGGVPSYFKFYLNSLNNVAFDTLLVSDCNFERLELPSNVRLVQMSMDEFRELASSKLGVEVKIDKPYKMCDFRPMFGLIFEDYLDGYRYWGYGDADLIYGAKLDEYVSMIVLGDYDVASMHRQYLSGPFAIIKNDKKGKALFMSSQVWENVATSFEHFQFEECGKNVDWPKLEFGEISIEEYGEDFDSFSAALHREEAKGTIRYFHDDLITEHISRSDTIYKRGAHVFLNSAEIYIFHNLFVKGRRYFKVPDCHWKSFDNYVICHTGYYSPRAAKWRGVIGLVRILGSIIESLKVNGFRRVISWVKGAIYEGRRKD